MEHIFGISWKILPDFNFYEFFKIQQIVSFRDKISCAEIIDTSRERNSATGYIFDIDGASLSHEIIEKLCTWPTTEDLQECTRIAFNEAILLAKHIHIYNYEEECLIPEFTKHIDIIDDIEDSECDELNEFIDTFNNEDSSSRSIVIGNAALEIARILPNSSNNDQLHEDETLNKYENSDNENSDNEISDNEISDDEISNKNEDKIQHSPSFNQFLDIQYIVQHSAIPVSFHSFQQFFTNETLDIKTLLQIRQNHDAFLPNIKSNFSHLHQTTIDKNIKGNANVVNKLITEITSNNIDEYQRKKCWDRWEGRNKLESLPKNKHVTNLGSANISDLNPLCENGFLIVYSNRILCLGKVNTMYEKCGERHAWVEKPVGFLDNLSYISIKVYMQVTNRVFSCENLVEGNITDRKSVV